MAELICLGEFMTGSKTQTARFLGKQLPDAVAQTMRKGPDDASR